jgi:hypothetical protein
VTGYPDPPTQPIEDRAPPRSVGAGGHRTLAGPVRPSGQERRRDRWHLATEPVDAEQARRHLGHVAPGAGGNLVTELNRGLGAFLEDRQRVAAVALDKLGGGQFGQTGRPGLRSIFPELRQCPPPSESPRYCCRRKSLQNRCATSVQGEAIEKVADALPEAVAGPLRYLAQQGLATLPRILWSG